MQRKNSLAHFACALGLTMLMIGVDVHAQIAFVSNRDGHSWEIYVMDDDGSNPRRLTNSPEEEWNPSWSPDGKHITFSSEKDGNSDIYVMDADGGNLQNLTNNPYNDWFPSWSPDGEYIAFSSERDGNFNIYVMEADGGNSQRLTNHLGDDWSPSWSPDGEHIAFVSNRVRRFEIYVMETDGRNIQNLTNLRSGNDSAPAWFRPTLAVAPADQKITMWGQLKGGVR